MLEISKNCKLVLRSLSLHPFWRIMWYSMPFDSLCFFIEVLSINLYLLFCITTAINALRIAIKKEVCVKGVRKSVWDKRKRMCAEMKCGRLSIDCDESRKKKIGQLRRKVQVFTSNKGCVDVISIASQILRLNLVAFTYLFLITLSNKNSLKINKAVQ